MDHHHTVVYDAHRVFAGTILDVGVTPSLVATLARRHGFPDVGVKVVSATGRVAYACQASTTLYFTPSMLTMHVALHEIAHLITGPYAGHNGAFVDALRHLVAVHGGEELAERFVERNNGLMRRGA